VVDAAQERSSVRSNKVTPGQACHGARLRLQEISERIIYRVHQNPTGGKPYPTNSLVKRLGADPKLGVPVLPSPVLPSVLP
jgi:hypothetical protein